MNNNNLTFSEAWQFPSKVEREIKGCAYSETKSTPDKFKSGRVLFKTTFYGADSRTITTRTSMQLTSKRTGRPYFVCETTAALERNATFRRPARPPTPPSGADAVAELYD